MEIKKTWSKISIRHKYLEKKTKEAKSMNGIRETVSLVIKNVNVTQF